METIMSRILIATALTIFAGTVSALAAAFEIANQGRQLLIKKPKIEMSNQNFEVLACFGCLSTTTGQPLPKYIWGHMKSNGTYISDYYKS